MTPWIVAHQASLSMGFPRPEYWSRWPFPSLRPVSVPSKLMIATPQPDFFTLVILRLSLAKREWRWPPPSRGLASVWLITNYARHQQVTYLGCSLTSSPPHAQLIVSVTLSDIKWKDSGQLKTKPLTSRLLSPWWEKQDIFTSKSWLVNRTLK